MFIKADRYFAVSLFGFFYQTFLAVKIIYPLKCDIIVHL